MSKELVSVIVVNYNGKEILEKCVQSIFSSSYYPLEVIIVDNSPLDGSADEVSRKYDVVLIKNVRNLGYSAGNNLGLREANGEYVLILNNDAILHPRAIDELVTEANRSKSQILQPKILMLNDSRIINSTGILIHVAGFGVLRGCGEEDSGQYDRSIDIGAPHGACFFANRNILKELGLFDEEFFAFCEDTDFGWRALLIGKKTRFVPSAIVFHKWGHAYNNDSLSIKMRLAERNRLIMVITNYQRSTMVLLLPIFFLAELSTLTYCAVHGLIRSKIKGYADLIQMKQYLVARRKRIQSMRRISDNSLLELFTSEFAHTYLGRPNKPLNMLFSLFSKFCIAFLN